MAEQKHRGPMGGGPRGMMPGEKAKDFKGTMGKLISYLGKYLPAIIAVMLFAIASTVFSIIGPKILGNATTELFNGIIAPAHGHPATSTLRPWPASCSSLALYIWSQPCCLISRALS